MSRTPDPRLLSYGDNAVLLHWEVSGFDGAVSDRIHALAARLREQPDFVEVMPGYDSLVVSFDSAALPLGTARQRVEDALNATGEGDAAKQGRLIEIPVHYGGEAGPDLDALASAKGLNAQDVIARHSGREYRVCMMGFIPGFAFLSDVDPSLQHPRHATPRAKVAAGSVGIANWQTGIYGLDSPGGWQIIGRTDAVMFDADRAEPFLAQAGDRIRFVPQ